MKKRASERGAPRAMSLLHVARPARRDPCRPRVALPSPATERSRSLAASAPSSGQVRHRRGGASANEAASPGGTTDASFSLSSSRSCRRLALLDRNRGARSSAYRAFSAVSSTHEAGSRSMTARKWKESARKGRKGPARRRQRTGAQFSLGRRRRRRARLLPLFFLLYLKESNQARASSLSPPPESHTLSPNSRFTPPALAARSCSRAA